MLVKAYFQCDIKRCKNTHEHNDLPTSYGNYIERPRAHTYKHAIPHLNTSVLPYLSEVTIDICQDHYDLIKEGRALIVKDGDDIILRKVRNG